MAVRLLPSWNDGMRRTGNSHSHILGCLLEMDIPLPVQEAQASAEIPVRFPALAYQVLLCAVSAGLRGVLRWSALRLVLLDMEPARDR